MGQSKTNLLERFAARAEDRPLLGRLLDLSDAADRRGRPQSSRFLDPRQQGLASAMLTAAARPYLLWGGYEGAERRVVVLLPEPLEQVEPSLAGIGLLRADTATPGLSHRDYLGALMGQRIERELIGDILVVQTMKETGFTIEDYSKRHHGGYLGEKSRSLCVK